MQQYTFFIPNLFSLLTHMTSVNFTIPGNCSLFGSIYLVRKDISQDQHFLSHLLLKLSFTLVASFFFKLHYYKQKGPHDFHLSSFKITPLPLPEISFFHDCAVAALLTPRHALFGLPMNQLIAFTETHSQSSFLC